MNCVTPNHNGPKPMDQSVRRLFRGIPPAINHQPSTINHSVSPLPNVHGHKLDSNPVERPMVGFAKKLYPPYRSSPIGNSSPAAPGFTLLEVLMVVAIIVILITLVVGAAAKSMSWARTAQTQTLLANLDSINEEYFGRTRHYFNSTVRPNTNTVPGGDGILIPPGSSQPVAAMSAFLTEAIAALGTPSGHTAAPGDVDIPGALGTALQQVTSGNYYVMDPSGTSHSGL